MTTRLLILAVLLAGLAAACNVIFPPRARSPLNGRMVTQEELEADFKVMAAQWEPPAADLKRQREMRERLNTLGMKMLVDSSGLVPFLPPGVGEMLGGILLGAGGAQAHRPVKWLLDKRKKRS